MPIRILAPQEAARIAAGEVIERPASVVKELIENALDAGARAITVETREGGIALIRVADDGCGIEPDELRLAFERHATSKVQAEDDLWRIATLGFRGEALPSIAAAGEVELVSRSAGSPSARASCCATARSTRRAARRAPPGTSFTVRRLFSAQPARLKFLRSPGAEATQMSTAVTHYALAYPEVRFTLRVDGAHDAADARQRRPARCRGRRLRRRRRGRRASPSMRRPQNEGEPGVAASSSSRACTARRATTSRSSSTAAGCATARSRSPSTRRTRACCRVGRFPIAMIDIRCRRTRSTSTCTRRRPRCACATSARCSPRCSAPCGGRCRSTRRCRSTSPALWSAQRGQRRRRRSAPPLILRTPRRAAARCPTHSQPWRARSDAPPVPAPMSERLPLLRAGRPGGQHVRHRRGAGGHVPDRPARRARARALRALPRAARAGAPELQPLLEPLPLELTAPHIARCSRSTATSSSALGFDVEPSATRRTSSARCRRRSPAAMSRARIVELLDRCSATTARRSRSHRVAASLACHAAVRAGMTMTDDEQRELLRLLEASESPAHLPPRPPDDGPPDVRRHRPRIPAKMIW